MRLNLGLLTALSLAAAGCAQQPAPPPPTPVANAAPATPTPMASAGSTAKRCIAPHIFNDSGFHVRMRVSNEGAACSFEASNTGGGRNATGGKYIYTGGSIATEPQHGTVALRFTPAASFVDYTPTAGYVGTDRFVVSLQPGTRPWEVIVTAAP